MQYEQDRSKIEMSFDLTQFRNEDPSGSRRHPPPDFVSASTQSSSTTIFLGRGSSQDHWTWTQKRKYICLSNLSCLLERRRCSTCTKLELPLDSQPHIVLALRSLSRTIQTAHDFSSCIWGLSHACEKRGP
ncbi:uncharacterized protein EI90DRAFT_2627810 [Cantharellus anzutake]|uniref:uncharacterized protein n=1 Tax=Cantharellus anzutake TaxID=1750568 RepID=UPI0019069737|nr:uncharacterized protein EI90DRAFT_2627810 [Cantharellus anzutake]KAF8319864.1 hypothetical protein EI90DRAFT_2627810 [Cantharellus anzutake]